MTPSINLGRILAFGGEYTLFAGLEECLKFIRDYRFHPSDIEYLRTVLPTYVEKEFFEYLETLDMNDIKVFAVPEGRSAPFRSSLPSPSCSLQVRWCFLVSH